MDRRLTRRDALRLLAGGVVAGAACTDGGRRLAADRSTTTTSPTSTSTTGSPATTSTAPTSTAPTTTASSPTTTTTSTTSDTQPPDTNPPSDGAPLAGFVAFGDSGGGPAQLAVAAAMERWSATHRVDALVTTGDNVYDFGEPHHFAAQLDMPYRALRESTTDRPGGRPFWTALGNHDVVRGHGPAQLAHLGLPALPYATDLPGARLLFLDTSRDYAAQATWLDQQLSLPGPGAKIAVFHAPVHSCGLHGPHPPVVQAWQPVLERHQAPLVLNGHDHLYHRFRSDSGVNYVVTGGGGYALYQHTPGCAPPSLVASHVRHHFTAVEVYAERLVLTAVADDDEVLDKAEIALAAVGS